MSKESAYTPSELSVYESYWDSVSREKTLISGKFSEGEAKGRVEGEAVGEARGQIKGRIDERHKSCRNMLIYGIDVETIIKTTGLTEKEVEKLKEHQ